MGVAYDCSMENMPSEENRPTASVNPYILPGSILLAALIVGGSLIYMVNSSDGNGGAPKTAKLENPVVPQTATTLPTDAVRGNPDAPVLIVEYGDYQCPFCGSYFNEVEPVLMQEYVQTGKAKMVFRNLAFLGPESVAAAEAAYCGQEQGKVWEYHDALYAVEIADFAAVRQENNGNLNRDLFLKIARDNALDIANFTQCVDDRKYADQVQQDNNAAAAIGVQSTPTTFVNGVKVVVLDANGDPVPNPQTGTTQSVGANGQAILNAVEAAVSGR